MPDPTAKKKRTDLFHVPGPDPGVLHRVQARLLGPLEQVCRQRLQLRPRQRDREVLGPRGVGGDEGKVDVCRRRTRQLALGLLGGFPQALDSELVSRQVDARVGLELLHEVLQESVVKVLASQESVPVGGLDLKDAAAHLEDGDVERASSEVVDCEEALLLVGAVGEGRGGGLVDDALDVEAGDASGVFLRGIPRVFEKERRGRGKGNDEPRGRKKRGVKGKLSRFALSLSSLSLTFRRLPLRVVEVGRDASAVSFILISVNAPIWLGEYLFPPASTHASPLSALTIL